MIHAEAQLIPAKSATSPIAMHVNTCSDLYLSRDRTLDGTDASADFLLTTEQQKYYIWFTSNTKSQVGLKKLKQNTIYTKTKHQKGLIPETYCRQFAIFITQSVMFGDPHKQKLQASLRKSKTAMERVCINSVKL